MRTQRCTQCGAKLNVSKIEEGSKFACFNCGSILVAGAVPRAVKRSLSEGPMYKPKAKQEEAATPTRSRVRRAPAEPKPASSKTPLVIGGVAVVVVAVVLVIALGGGDGAGSTGSDGGAATKTASEWWREVGPRVDTASAPELKRLLKEAQASGYDKDPAWRGMSEEIFTALLSKDPDDEAANLHFGKRSLADHPGFTELWAKMIANYKLLTPEAKAFLAKYEDTIEGGKVAWLDAEEFEAAGAVLKSFRDWTKRLEEDPSIQQIERARMRAKEELPGFDAGVAVARPFLIFVAFRKGEGGESAREGRNRTAKKYAPALAKLVSEFDERFAKPLKLERDKRALQIWVFETKGDYDTFVQEKRLFGKGVPDILACFNVKSGTAYAGIPADQSVARYTSRDLTHVGAHQLQWLSSRSKFSNYFDEWNGLWFTAGFASWLGGGIRLDESSGSASFTGLDPRRTSHLKLMRDNELGWVTLRDLTQIESWEGLRRWVVDTWWPQVQADEDVAEETLDVIRQIGLHVFAYQTFYAQAYGLAHFLNEKHPEKLRDLVLTAMRGKRKPEKYQTDRLKRWRNTYTAFAAIMGLTSDADWGKLNKEYEAHLDGLAKK